MSAKMSFLKGRMTTIGVVSAILALIAVQAVAFQQTGKKNDAFKPAAAANTSQPASSQDLASDTPSDSPLAADETTAASETSPAAKPAITGASVGDDEGGEGEGSEGEQSDD